MFKQITSIHNPLVKEILVLQEKSRARKKTGMFIIEGKREISLAIKGAYTLQKILYCDAIFKATNINYYCTQNTEIIEISTEVYHKIAQRASTEGIIALAKSRELNLKNIQLQGKNSLILVAEAPEKPGNIGALLRTADAANVDAVFIANPKTDMYNPNIIRSSIGCVFTNKIATASTSEIISFLKDNNIPIYSASLQASVAYHTQNFTKATAIVVGTEATGLSTQWVENSVQNIMIPMQGQIDSLNVSVSAAILIFEVKRQRNFS